MVDDYNSDLNKATRPLDPYNPGSLGAGTGPGRYDQYGNARFEPVEETGRGPYILLGLLVALGVIGGLLYFNHTPRDANTAQAPTITDTRPAPVTPAAPGAAPLRGTMTPSAPSDSGAATPAPLSK
jgi:hypothetical protein